MAKADRVDGDPVEGVVPAWHFLGRLQRNKVRQLAPVVSVWESVDRVELVAEIAAEGPGRRGVRPGQPVRRGAEGRGAARNGAGVVARARAAGLSVEGLMGVGPAGDPERSRPGFRALVALADELGLPQRSIGMSADLEVAVQEGATLVRVGRDLFGPRPPRPSTAG